MIGLKVRCNDTKEVFILNSNNIDIKEGTIFFKYNNNEIILDIKNISYICEVLLDKIIENNNKRLNFDIDKFKENTLGLYSSHKIYINLNKLLYKKILEEVSEIINTTIIEE